MLLQRLNSSARKEAGSLRLLYSSRRHSKGLLSPSCHGDRLSEVARPVLRRLREAYEVSKRDRRPILEGFCQGYADLARFVPPFEVLGHIEFLLPDALVDGKSEMRDGPPDGGE